VQSLTRSSIDGQLALQAQVVSDFDRRISQIDAAIDEATRAIDIGYGARLAGAQRAHGACCQQAEIRKVN
jgi:hypothetical protein